MNEKICISLASLDGYLGGITSLSGGIRQYLSCAFMTERKNSDVVAEVVDFYAPNFQLQCSTVELMPDGLKRLEMEIQPYLIQNLLGHHTQFELKVIEDRKRYLAFRIMDMIQDVLDYDYKNTEVYKFTAFFNDVNYTFFSVACKNMNLNLQFSENYKEHRA